MSISYKEMFPAEVCLVQGKPFLFTNMRVDRKTIPEGMYAYDVRDDCDGEFWEIQQFVMVNHWGTIIGFEPVELEDGQYWCPPDENDPETSTEGGFVTYVNNEAEFKKIANEGKENQNGN